MTPEQKYYCHISSIHPGKIMNRKTFCKFLKTKSKK